ncbi:hypothetical protein MYX84_10595 [Acidobacteria bacterium AH-259-O06]|nr:hypothetical protein [Acidobacteria bacterium AH-259-O06]
MKCPRCGLINPDTAQRCDCGYDFEKGTVESSYYKQELPKDIKTYLIIIVVVNVLVALAALMGGDPIRIVFVLIWSAGIYGLYSQLMQKKNWARMALIVLTFPIGLFLMLSREVKLYCLQKNP